MNVKLKADKFGGEIEAIPSKSYAHRQLICAAMSENPSQIKCKTISKDIIATAECLRSLGANINYNKGIFEIIPVKMNDLPEKATLDVGESGSTFRFMLPIVCALGIETEFVLHGRLADRPLTPLYEELVNNGISLSTQGSNPFRTKGKLDGRNFKMPANISSQFISGILLALPLVGGGTVELIGQVQSASYIDITTECMKQAGIDISFYDNTYAVSGVYKIDKLIETEGDWSNSSFWLCAGAIAKNPVSVTGLNLKSLQGDRKVIEIIKNFGGEILESANKLTSIPSKLKGISIDASDIPDLIPILSLLAACADGKTEIFNAERLRLKESDRIESTCDILNKLGVVTEQTSDGIIIYGSDNLYPCKLSGWNDHRIAMLSAIAAVAVDGEIYMEGAECVSKSYPDFFEDYMTLNGEVVKECFE